MKLKITLTLLCLLVAFGLYSQDKEIKPGKPNDLDKLYTPDKNSSNPSNGSSSSNNGASGKSNLVKFNFALLARSTFALFYERKITDGFSVQGGLGYCYGKDKAQFVMSEGDYIYFSDNKSSLNLGDIIYNGTYRNGANPFLSASFRFAYNGLYSGWYGNEDRNSYIELGMRYYSHHYDYRNSKNSYEIINGGTNLSVRNLCYMVTWGYQFETDTKLVTSHEFYTGAGLRRSKYNMFTSTQTQGSSYQTIITHNKSSLKEVAISPIFTVGYVLGFGF
jgi:hypothetical protein